MKYRNANSILPGKLVEILQEYVQGEYIIKQRGRYSMVSQIIGQIIVNWEIQNERIKQIYDTAWQIGDNYVLKVYHDLDMLKRNLKILHILDSMDVPVGKIVLTKKGESYIVYEDAYYFLSEKLHGNNLTQLDNEHNIALKMGEIIADLHIAFQKCENETSFWNNSLLDEMNGWVKSNFEKHHWKYIEKDDYENMVLKLEEIYHELPIQLIHRDVHFGNFLFDGDEFSGYIDFDLTQRNVRIFDICYFVLGLLSEEEKIEITKDAWFDFVKNVFDGYGRKLPLSEKERLAAPYVMECIELLFVSWFMEENDVRCAEDAYNIFDFVRKEEERIWKSVGVV